MRWCSFRLVCHKLISFVVGDSHFSSAGNFDYAFIWDVVLADHRVVYKELKVLLWWLMLARLLLVLHWHWDRLFRILLRLSFSRLFNGLWLLQIFRWQCDSLHRIKHFNCRVRLLLLLGSLLSSFFSLFLFGIDTTACRCLSFERRSRFRWCHLLVIWNSTWGRNTGNRELDLRHRSRRRRRLRVGDELTDNFISLWRRCQRLKAMSRTLGRRVWLILEIRLVDLRKVVHRFVNRW